MCAMKSLPTMVILAAMSVALFAAEEEAQDPRKYRIRHKSTVRQKYFFSSTLYVLNGRFFNLL